MGFIMDYIKNDVIEEKRLINGMIKDNVPMSRIKEVTERSKREIEAILAFPDNPSQNELYAIQAVWREGAIRKYLKEIKERETEYKADIENYRKEGHSWEEIFEMMHLCFPVLMLESLWEHLDRMRRLRQQYVVLMDDDPLKIAKAIRIARKCLRIVYENICFAIGIKLLCLFLVTIGIAKYVDGNFCRCWCYGDCCAECNPRTFCKKIIGYNSAGNVPVERRNFMEKEKIECCSENQLRIALFFYRNKRHQEGLLQPDSITRYLTIARVL